jgi:hypothetical protein
MLHARTTLEISRAEKNGSVRLRLASKVFRSRGPLNCLMVRVESFELVFVIRAKMTVQGFPADRAPHAVFSILAPEDD